ncbi:MAG: biotin--[acetyl-CoA-carboxylase] ligase [Anaerovoracaceae bacterium]|jgi:BirA family biotin operon repressor/biotin-[acetyl-CoA-carboxylase] ligase
MDTKHAVLMALEENKGRPVSGSKLAQQLDISRTAVWKAITSLKDEGYDIQSGRNKGYQLSSHSDMLSEEAVRAELRHQVPLYIYDSLESTNKTAASLAMDGAPAGTTVIAAEQTNGRGRRGRSFYSPKDTGLYLSMILEPEGDMTQAVLITSAVAVAVSRAIDDVSGKKSRIKWVNDVYLDGKKVSGTLTEALTDFETGSIGHIVTGIGVNCSTEHFPDSAGSNAGSIGGGFSRSSLAARIIDNVMDTIGHLEERSFIEEYRRRSMVIGKDIDVYHTIGGEPFPARAIDIDKDGGLVIQRPDGSRETLSTGEITIRLK